MKNKETKCFRTTTTTMLSDIEFLLVILLSILIGYVSTTSLGGGNAVDLAQMNTQLMSHSKNCPLVPCQSACLKKNVTSGCYECMCGSSSSMNMVGGPGQGLNMPGGNMMSCSNLNGFFNCPSQCQATVNAWGCTECKCQGQTENSWRGEGQLSTSQSVTSLQTSESPKTPDRSTVTRKTTVTVPMSSTTHVPTTSLTTTTSSTSTELPSTSIPPTNTFRVAADSSKTHLYRRTTASTKVTTNKPFERTTYIIGNADKLNTIKTEEKTNVIIIFVLSTALIVALTVCVVFLIAWRKTARELRKQRDDVYFFHKSVRQELSNKTPGLPEPVYAHISSTPEPPPRTPPMSPLSPDFLLRSVSLSSETPLKETDFDAQSRHDYLQLM